MLVNGFAAAGHQMKDVSFENVRLPAGAIVKVNACQDVRFANVTTVDGKKPRYEITPSDGVQY